MPAAMIWGANGGIGRALVELLTEQDWTVIAVTHTPRTLDMLTPHVFDANTAVPYEVQLAAQSMSTISSKIDLSVYAAGDITSANASEMDLDQWSRIVDANLTGAFVTTRYGLPLMAEEGHMVYLGAISERLMLPKLSAYVAAKAGLEAFVAALSKEERKRRFTVVRPGAVDTPFWEKVPLGPPKNAMAPRMVAQKILEAYKQHHTGQLDLTQPATEKT
ncbi:MAG: SDR family NAD(P)-dependent oxidoreductase [Anaerolineae bacterium]|nr:SDR family NAD(P)-dependent oxidoreductase [Anaerolineae bacterium]